MANQHTPEFFRNEVERELKALALGDHPKELYDPIRYMLDMGGKRIRPALVMAACEMFGGDYKKAMPAALAIEIFHNFTLVHDDIMDEAPLRRGKETVYQKWNNSIAILAGDTMLSIAYDMLLDLEDTPIKPMIRLFNQTSIEVCEGQQMDMNFETAFEVTIEDYLEMIRLKTSVLLAASLKLGAMVAGTDEADADRIYRFGEAIGLAFQLKDDYLDVYGDKALFGKQESGDIVTNKKTFLILKALEKSNESDRQRLLDLYSVTLEDNVEKIREVKEIFEKYSIQDETLNLIGNYHQKALGLLEEFDVPEESLSVLKTIAEGITTRKY